MQLSRLFTRRPAGGRCPWRTDRCATARRSTSRSVGRKRRPWPAAWRPATTNGYGHPFSGFFNFLGAGQARGQGRGSRRVRVLRGHRRAGNDYTASDAGERVQRPQPRPALRQRPGWTGLSDMAAESTSPAAGREALLFRASGSIRLRFLAPSPTRNCRWSRTSRLSGSDDEPRAHRCPRRRRPVARKGARPQGRRRCPILTIARPGRRTLGSRRATSETTINSVLAGQHLVIKGAARHRQVANHRQLHGHHGRPRQWVLFVAEKRVLIDAWSSAAMTWDGDIVLDMMVGSGSRRQMAQGLTAATGSLISIARGDYVREHQLLESPRNELNSRVDALHRKREPWLRSLFEVQGNPRLDSTAATTVPFQALAERLTRTRHACASNCVPTPGWEASGCASKLLWPPPTSPAASRPATAA